MENLEIQADLISALNNTTKEAACATFNAIDQTLFNISQTTLLQAIHLKHIHDNFLMDRQQKQLQCNTEETKSLIDTNKAQSEQIKLLNAQLNAYDCDRSNNNQESTSPKCLTNGTMPVGIDVKSSEYDVQQTDDGKLEGEDSDHEADIQKLIASGELRPDYGPLWDKIAGLFASISPKCRPYIFYINKYSSPKATEQLVNKVITTLGDVWAIYKNDLSLLVKCIQYAYMQKHLCPEIPPPNWSSVHASDLTLDALQWFIKESTQIYEQRPTWKNNFVPPSTLRQSDTLSTRFISLVYKNLPVNVQQALRKASTIDLHTGISSLFVLQLFFHPQYLHTILTKSNSFKLAFPGFFLMLLDVTDEGLQILAKTVALAIKANAICENKLKAQKIRMLKEINVNLFCLVNIMLKGFNRYVSHIQLLGNAEDIFIKRPHTYNFYKKKRKQWAKFIEKGYILRYSEMPLHRSWQYMSQYVTPPLVQEYNKFYDMDTKQNTDLLADVQEQDVDHQNSEGLNGDELFNLLP